MPEAKPEEEEEEEEQQEEDDIVDAGAIDDPEGKGGWEAMGPLPCFVLLLLVSDAPPAPPLQWTATTIRRRMSPEDARPGSAARCPRPPSRDCDGGPGDPASSPAWKPPPGRKVRRGGKVTARGKDAPGLPAPGGAPAWAAETKSMGEFWGFWPVPVGQGCPPY